MPPSTAARSWSGMRPRAPLSRPTDMSTSCRPLLNETVLRRSTLDDGTLLLIPVQPRRHPCDRAHEKPTLATGWSAGASYCSSGSSPSATWTTHPSCFRISYPCNGSPVTVSAGSLTTGVSEPEWTPSATGRISTGGGMPATPGKCGWTDARRGIAFVRPMRSPDRGVLGGLQ